MSIFMPFLFLPYLILKMLLLTVDLRNDSIHRMLNSDWDRVAPIILLYERNTPHSRRASAVLRHEYLGSGPIENPGSLQALGRLYSDAIIGSPYNHFMKLMAPHTPIYTYYFRYKGRYSFLRNPDTNTTMGMYF